MHIVDLLIFMMIDSLSIVLLFMNFQEFYWFILECDIFIDLKCVLS